jgi:LCP family protein required for cell wall assembly
MTILAIGSDERSAGYLYGLADTIRIIRVDFITPQVSMLDFPRDLWVEIPGIADHYGVTHGKLNQAYFFGNPGMGYYDGPGEGPGLMARTLDLNFGLRVDHYLAINMQTFVGAIDAMGGIDVYVESPIDLNSPGSTVDPELELSVGVHHLDGNLALILARNRTLNTFQRANYQNIILNALRDRIFSPSIITELPQLIAGFQNSVQTDLSPNDINQLVCLGQKLTGNNIINQSFPENMFTPGRVYDPYRNVNTFIFTVDFDQIRSYVADFMNGTWPSP